MYLYSVQHRCLVDPSLAPPHRNHKTVVSITLQVWVISPSLTKSHSHDVR